MGNEGDPGGLGPPELCQLLGDLWLVAVAIQSVDDDVLIGLGELVWTTW